MLVLATDYLEFLGNQRSRGFAIDFDCVDRIDRLFGVCEMIVEVVADGERLIFIRDFSAFRNNEYVTSQCLYDCGNVIVTHRRET